jgi:mRNA interferase MazF
MSLTIAPVPSSQSRSIVRNRARLPAHAGDTTSALPKRSWVKISQVRSLSVERLGKKLGRIAPEELERIIEGLNEIIAG